MLPRYINWNFKLCQIGLHHRYRRLIHWQFSVMDELASSNTDDPNEETHSTGSRAYRGLDRDGLCTSSLLPSMLRIPIRINTWWRMG